MWVYVTGGCLDAHPSERRPERHLLFLLLFHGQVDLRRARRGLQIGERPRLGTRRKHVGPVSVLVYTRRHGRHCHRCTSPAGTALRNFGVTFVEHAGRGPSFQHRPVLERGTQLFVGRVALVLGGQLSVQRACPAAGPTRGTCRAVVGPGLGQAPPRRSTAAVW